VGQEVSRLLQVIFAGFGKRGEADLEAAEMLVRSSMHSAGPEIPDACCRNLLRQPARVPAPVATGHNIMPRDRGGC
jgi:hypothetical protein